LCYQHGGSPMLARHGDFRETYHKSSTAGRPWLKRPRKTPQKTTFYDANHRSGRPISDAGHRLDHRPTQNFQWEFAFIFGDQSFYAFCLRRR
jgi:hypothetical protein